MLSDHSPAGKNIKRQLKVSQLHRRANAAQFSVERYFEELRPHLEGLVQLSQKRMAFESRGVFRRIWNILIACCSQADVNHVTGDVNYVTLMLARSRTILTVLDCQVLSRLTGWRRAVVKWLWFTLPARRVTRITTISEATKEALLREVDFPPERIHVIPVCVSPRFQPSPREFNTLTPRILQIGTKPNKNVIRLARALAGLPVELDIVGPITKELACVLEESRISYRSFERLSDDQIIERYKEADIVALVSTEEGFGMPIIEAQCVERVCITSNCSSMPEVAGSGACLVDPFDVHSIRAGFQRIIADSEYRLALIEAGRENRRRFDVAQIAKQYADLYQLVRHGSSTA